MKKLVIPSVIVAIIAICSVVTRNQLKTIVYGGNEDGKVKTY